MMFSITDGLKLPQTIEFAQRADELLYDADITPLTKEQTNALSYIVKETLPLGMAAKRALDEENAQPRGPIKGFVRSAARVFSSQEHTCDDIYRDHLLAMNLVRLVAKEAFENRLQYVEQASFTADEITVMREIEKAFIFLNVPDDSYAYERGSESLYSASTEGRVTSTGLLMDLHNRGVGTYRFNGEVYVYREPLSENQGQLPHHD